MCICICMCIYIYIYTHTYLGSTSHTYSGGCFAAEGGLNTAAAIRAVKICDKDG